MEAATHPSADALACLEKKSPAQFPPLESVTSPTVPTDAAAFYVNRKKQTLLVWSCQENGPIRPLRINGRLAWPVPELRKLCGVS